MSDRRRDRSGGQSSDLTHHEWGEAVQPAIAVVRAVAARSGRQATDLQPLARVIDTDSLNRLLGLGDSTLTVSFRYEGFDVRVAGDGHVTVAPRGDDA